jgi:putative hydrolase of the HAD superfamily
MVPVNRSPLALSPRTVIVDYGEVISRSPSAADRAVIEQLAGVDLDKFWASYWAHRPELDLAVEGVREYWAAIAADTGADWDDGRVCELWLADYRSWLSVSPDVIGVLADLRAGGTRLALLSNAAPDFGSYFRHGIFGGYLDAVYVSGELKLLKPGAEIYRHVLDDLGIAASEAIFIDNRAENVRGAEELGITGHVFTDAATLRAFLESLAAARLPRRRGPSSARRRPRLRRQSARSS